jgi:molecular chaperone DnaK
MTVVGIDLGTTNTVVAAARQGRVATLKDDSGRALLPSVVSFHPSGEVLVGAAAKERRTVDARNTIFSVKRLIGRSWDNEHVQRARSRLPFVMKEGPGKSTLVEARGHTYTLAEISAYVLGRAKEIAEARLGETVEECVITVPANFNDLQRAATKVAGRVAGLEVLRILNEPTAAALAYGFGKGGRERLAVYDFGGGTFDITLLDQSNNVFEVLATAGDTFLGGDDIDRLIAERMAETLLAKHRVDAGGDAQLFERLRAAAEDLKIELGQVETARVTLREVAHRAFGKPLDFEFAFTRAELDAVTTPLVDRTLDVCREALGVAGLTPGDFDQLLLVGGSTRLPLVQRVASGFWGREPHGRIHPDEVVALGAAIQATALGSSASTAGSSRRRPTEIPTAPIPAASLRPGARSDMPSGTNEAAVRPRMTSIPPQTNLGSLRPRQTTLAPTSPGAGRTEHSLLSRLEPRPSAPDLGGATGAPNTPLGAPTPTLGKTAMGLGPASPAVPTGAVRIQPLVPLEPEDLDLENIEELSDDDLFDRSDLSGLIQPSPALEPLPTAPDTLGFPDPATELDASLEFDVAKLEAAAEFEELEVDELDEAPQADLARAPAAPGPLPALPAVPGPLMDPTPPITQRSDFPAPWPAATAAAEAPAPDAAHAPPLLIDVTPLALGVEVVGGFCDILIERNSPVPCERSRQFVTARDDQTTVRVRVCQGQSVLFVENTLLGDVVLTGLRPAPRGTVGIEVAFALDESGMLNVSARDTETGASTHAELRLIAVG